MSKAHAHKATRHVTSHLADHGAVSRSRTQAARPRQHGTAPAASYETARLHTEELDTEGHEPTRPLTSRSQRLTRSDLRARRSPGPLTDKSMVAAGIFTLFAVLVVVALLGSNLATSPVSVAVALLIGAGVVVLALVLRNRSYSTGTGRHRARS